MSRSLVTWSVIALFALILTFNTLFIVDQRHQAIITRFGEPVRVLNSPRSPNPGLHMKAPFLDEVILLDKRNLAQEAEEEEITGSDQQRLVVDAFIRYRISNPLQYFRTLRDANTANDRIERLLNSSLRQVLGTATSKDIVSSRRGALMLAIRTDMARRAQASKFGIEVIDVRIRRADLPAQNLPTTFRRMQTARQQEAAQYRAQGEQQKREIIAAADKEVVITLAEATQAAEQVRGEGDALRTRIFAQSFGRDPSFAAFYRSMQAYESSLGQGDTTMVLSPDSAFFRYFERGPAAR